MSDQILWIYAVGVFVLMSIGIILTMIEFARLTDEPSLRKGPGSGNETAKAKSDPEQPNLKSVDGSRGR